MSTQDLLILCLILGWAVLFTTGLSITLAHFGGWRKLARTYPPVEPASNSTRMLGSLSMGGAARYNNAVFFRLDESYLHMRMIPILPFHPRMSIPLVAIESIEPHFMKGWSKVLVNNPQSGNKLMVMPTRILKREITTRDALAAENQPTEPVSKSAFSTDD